MTASSVPERLLRSSARHSYDPDVDLDWDAPEVPGLWWMQPERMSLYGTRLWDTLSEEQQKELSTHEVASIASVGLWFELLLMQMMVRDLYDDDPTGAHMHYALTEIADECRHSTMFGKSIAHFGVPAYGPPPKVHRLGRLVARKKRPRASVLRPGPYAGAPSFSIIFPNMIEGRHSSAISVSAYWMCWRRGSRS